MARKNVIDKDFTYFSIIKEAILFFEDKKATSAQIFDYMMKKHPECFNHLNSITWKNNVRQLLSKCPEFVKSRKEKNSKLHYWKFVEYKLLEQDYQKNNPRYCRNQEYNDVLIPTPRQTLGYVPNACIRPGYYDYDNRYPNQYSMDYYSNQGYLHPETLYFPSFESQKYQEMNNENLNSFNLNKSLSSSDSG